ncbi:hypothetical protein GGG16DRAFT_85662, partial [Schizophyllum commune]
MRMLPLLGALYALALVDRSNLSVARVAGLDASIAAPVQHHRTQGRRAALARRLRRLLGHRPARDGLRAQLDVACRTEPRSLRVPISRALLGAFE